MVSTKTFTIPAEGKEDRNQRGCRTGGHSLVTALVVMNQPPDAADFVAGSPANSIVGRGVHASRTLPDAARCARAHASCSRSPVTVQQVLVQWAGGHNRVKMSPSIGSPAAAANRRMV